MNPYPLKFGPIFKERIWGGRRLAEMFGKDLPAGKRIGESWELADLPEDKSVIVNGELAGMTIGEAARKYPAELTGRKDFKGSFSLLVKILDAEDVLSVQVHPDEEFCRRTGRGTPKTECWYIISAVPGAVIYKGFKFGVTRESFTTAIRSGTVAELLCKVEVHPSECHLLPAGTPHAIGAGLVIAEIQAPSDTTYRVFDWGRLGENGKPRELHIADALESIHFQSDELPVTTVGRLVDTKYFKVDKGHRSGGAEVLFSGTMKLVVIISGRGRFMSEKVGPVEFASGDTVLLPAAYEGAAVLSAETEYLIITV
jgi:mannose-6-phosphate isomerase